MSMLDWGILILIAVCCVGAIIYLRRHGNPCSGCNGECENCKEHKTKKRNRR